MSMLIKTKNHLSIIILLMLIFSSQLANATDGYFSIAYGTRSKGMGGAGVAMYENSLFGANNPAGLVMYGKGYGLSVELFNPNRSYTVYGVPSTPSSFPPAFGLTEGKVTSSSKMFIMPSFAANFMLDSKNSVGIAIYGNGGMNTNYHAKTFYAPKLDGPVMPDGSNPMNGVSQPTGVNLMQLFAAVQYSHSFCERLSVGVAAIGGWQSFEAKGLQAFANLGMSQSPNNLTNNGADKVLGIGGKIGVISKISNRVSLGATFQTPIWMQAFSKYKGLFAQNGNFDIPMNWSASIAYKASPKVLFALDVKQIFYSKINSIGNKLNVNALLPMIPDSNGQFVQNPYYTPLGSSNGSGFGWKDMLIIKVGGEYFVTSNSCVRVGFSHGNSPVRSSEVMFNMLAPGVVESHVTVGFTQNIGDKAIDFAIVHAFNHTISGQNPLDPAQTIKLQMNQWEFEVGFRF